LHYNVGKCVFLPLQQDFYSKSRHAYPQNSSQIYAYEFMDQSVPPRQIVTMIGKNNYWQEAQTWMYRSPTSNFAL